MSSRGINKVILIGHLGNDPTVRYTPDNKAVTSISLATSDVYKDKEGQQQEQTEWHKVVFFSRLAEIAGEYLKKGSKVYIEGKLKTRKWQDKEGQDRYTTEIVANEMQMLDSRGGSSNTDSGAQDFGDEHNSRSSNKSSKGSAPQRVAAQDAFDDDVPF